MHSLRNSGFTFTPKELYDAGMPLQSLRTEGGFTATQLLDENGFTLRQVLDAGYKCQELLQVGVGVAHLMTWFTVRELISAGIHPVELRKAGVTARQLRKAGLTIENLRHVGFTATQLSEIGFTISDFRASGFTARQLQAAGYSLADLSSSFEIVTTHVVSQRTDGLVSVSCFGIGGEEIAFVEVHMSAGMWELLDAVEKEAERSVMFLLPDGHVVTPHDATQSVEQILTKW